MFNPIVQGWINYYGRFYKSWLYLGPATHQRLSGSLGHEEVQAVARPHPGAKAWLAERRPTGAAPVRPLEAWRATRRLGDGSRMSREVHVRFCESGRGRFPPATHLVVLVAGTYAHAEALWVEVAGVLHRWAYACPRRKRRSPT